ncbi:ComF family protein [Candidatus Dojkabacteria bacterium]|uniref:ComF family protein n=1 Tax=Candidatus Dojkabacteria bacterium TaxID=2099670 RepID=A0A955L273_9BACT|nr:ComF family protein [Candidatus Dojkabacteria bacterium]
MCGRAVRHGFVHKECSSKTNLDGLIFISVYNKLVKDIIHHGKYEKNYGVFEDLGTIAGQFVKKYYTFSMPLITFVPLSFERKLWRGFNQSEVFAKNIGNILNVPVIKNLKRTRNTKSQAGTSKKARAENIRGAFRLVDNNVDKYKTIILVDDVFTTGATLEECAREIKRKYPNIKVFGLTFATSRLSDI